MPLVFAIKLYRSSIQICIATSVRAGECRTVFFKVGAWTEKTSFYTPPPAPGNKGKKKNREKEEEEEMKIKVMEEKEKEGKKAEGE